MTSAVVAKWCETAKAQASLGTMRYLTKAYRMACHYGDSEEEVRACACTAFVCASPRWYRPLCTAPPHPRFLHFPAAFLRDAHRRRPSPPQVATSMRIASAAVYNQLMLFMLKESDGIFRRMLGIDKKAPTAVTLEDLTKSNKWRKVAGGWGWRLGVGGCVGGEGRWEGRLPWVDEVVGGWGHVYGALAHERIPPALTASPSSLVALSYAF